MRLWFLALSFGTLAASAVTQPKISTKCVESHQPLPWTYCKSITEGSRNRDILYYFHGKTLSAKTWAETDYYTNMVREEWARRGQQAPVVVAVSFGPIWLLVEKNQSPASGLFEVFTRVVMPTVEKTVAHFSGRRLLVGESMGGFNATQIALKAGDLFARVAILCPPIVPISPFASKDEIEKFTVAAKANPKLVEQIIQISRYFMPEEADWKRSSPLALATTNLSWRSPKLYVSCGLYDEYGFFRGAEKFAETGQLRGARVQWRPIYGGHCAIDPPSLAAFLR